MSPVAGGINGDILRMAGDAALQNSFQRGELVVTCTKAQVVNIENELQRIISQLLYNIGNLRKLVFVKLYETDSLVIKSIGTGFDGGGFSGACVSVEENVAGSLAIG